MFEYVSAVKYNTYPVLDPFPPHQCPYNILPSEMHPVSLTAGCNFASYQRGKHSLVSFPDPPRKNRERGLGTRLSTHINSHSNHVFLNVSQRYPKVSDEERTCSAPPSFLQIDDHSTWRVLQSVMPKKLTWI